MRICLCIQDLFVVCFRRVSYFVVKKKVGSRLLIFYYGISHTNRAKLNTTVNYHSMEYGAKHTLVFREPDFPKL
jgi:hypothetical protein